MRVAMVFSGTPSASRWTVAPGGSIDQSRFCVLANRLGSGRQTELVNATNAHRAMHKAPRRAVGSRRKNVRTVSTL